MKNSYEVQYKKAIQAGINRDYQTSIVLFEDLAAKGWSEQEPEVFLYLARSYHALGLFAQAVQWARVYISYKNEDGAGWFFLGRAYFSEGDFSHAVYALKKSLEFNPDSIAAQTFLGFSLLRCKKISTARAVFEKALEIAPDDDKLNQGYRNALFIEAVRTWRRGDAELARQMLTFLINNDIDGVVPRLYLAHALRDLGYVQEAISQYEAAREFAPEDVALAWYPIYTLLESGDKKAALERLRTESLTEGMAEGIELSGPSVALSIIKNHLDQESWKEALDASRSFIKTFGEQAQIHSFMGESFRNLGNADLAIAQFNRALNLDKKDATPYYGLVMVYLGASEWELLLETIKKAEKAGCDPESLALYKVLSLAHLDYEPTELLPKIQAQIRVSGSIPELIEALARTYFKIGLASLALGWYRKLNDLDPSEESLLGYLASLESVYQEETLNAAEKKKISKELRDVYKQYLDKWADNVAIRKDCISFLENLSQWQACADETELLLSYEPSIQHERELALYRRKAGQYKKAAIIYRNHLRQNPESHVLLVNLVYCLDKMGESKSALTLIQHAHKAFKPSKETLEIEGKMLEKLEKGDDAIEHYRRMIDIFPNDPTYWERIANIYEKRKVPEMAAMYREKARDLTHAPEKNHKRKKQ